MKNLVIVAFIALLLSCKSDKPKEINVLQEDEMKLVTEVASIGNLKKISYKLREARQDSKGEIELLLYKGPMSNSKYNDLDLAINTSKAFLNKFDQSGQYEYIIVKLIESEKGMKDTLLKEKKYTFLSSKIK